MFWGKPKYNNLGKTKYHMGLVNSRSQGPFCIMANLVEYVENGLKWIFVGICAGQIWAILSQ